MAVDTKTGTEEADVVIIGAGAGGAACAWALARRGVRSVLLESGPAYDVSDYRLDREDWEATPFPSRDTAERHTYPTLQRLDTRFDGLRTWNHILGRLVAGERREVGRYHHVRGVGGSTLHFTGEAHRMHPAAMRMKSRFGVAADWPIGYAELDPYYLQAERAIGVAGPPSDIVRPRSAAYPLPPHKPSVASQRVAEGCRRLGLSWTANALAILSAPYDDRPGCNYCGNCQRGCPRRDKGSVDVTLIAQATASGRCRIVPNAHVLRLNAGDRDRVLHAEWVDANGIAHRIAGRAIVVACGAVETPRLLLNSTSAGTTGGLSNESGQVGRNFMETLAWTSSALHPDALGSHRGLPSDGICWDFNAPDAVPGVAGGCRFTLGMAESDLIGPFNYARRVVPGWGRSHRKAMQETFGRVLSIGSIGEFLPNADSYVDLDPAKRDAHGLPLARIRSVLADQDLRRLDFMASKCREILAASGADKPFEEGGSYDLFNATHVFGTCRMGTQPRDSVVDRNCRSHRWRNLFIADASVFPSSGGGESPSLTIEALAIRAGEFIGERLVRGDL